MNYRVHIRNLLLLLVAGSLVYLIVQDRLAARRIAIGPSNQQPPRMESGAGTKLIVYYLAQGKNCSTCERIPLFARETLESNFAGDLASGAIVWREIDVDAPENEHYITDFGLYTKSLVLARLENGAQVRFKNLESVWDLVYDKPAFEEYVRTEVRDMLGAGK